METPGDSSDLMRGVVADVIGDVAVVDVQTPGSSCRAHVTLTGLAGRGCELLTDGEGQEARFQEPRGSAVILSDGTDPEVDEALRKLARASREYLDGRFRVGHKRGLFGSKPIVVLQTPDGEWRIGRRSGRIPL